MADDGAASGQPQWPAGARELPDPGALPGRSLDGWLAAAAAVYPVAGFGLLLAGGGRMGPAAFGPEVVLLPALVAVGVVVGVKLQSESLRWSSVLALAESVSVVAFGQLWVWAEAVAAV